MFENATLKLTGWYLLIIMVISLLFSVLVFQSASSEVNARLEQFGRHLPAGFEMRSNPDVESIRNAQAEQAAHNILINLLYINCLVLAAGGVASYLMARRTLRPVQEAHEVEMRFVSDASHELRTPLAVMKTELEVALKDKTVTADDMRKLLESNLEEVDKLTKLSQTLLTLSKMDFSKLVHEEVPFQATVLSVIDRYDKARKRITVKQRSKPLILDAHQPSIEELFTVLVDNALKYSPPDSPITISLGKRNNKAEFVISNAGKGISETDLPHIFDRFYRADNARTNHSKTSFGLGLSLAKTIVQLHHGELIASSAPDKETTFTILLPILRKTQAKNQ
ncbi:MAG: putative Histidine kinase [Candidatus Saccharibacteria bacterium]|nr:putative Histidine kinase [Candidatus Saccharibacteria bacterium]